MRPRRAVRLTAIAGLASLMGVLAIAALHLPQARPWLAKLGWSCPTQRVTAAEVQAARDYGLARLRGTDSAPGRPALGFRLQASDEAEVLRWSERYRLNCRVESRGLRSLECADVPAIALALPYSEERVDSLTVAFDAGGRVVAVDALRRNLEPRRASDCLRAARGRLIERLGPPTESLGESDAGDLAGAPFRTAFVRYRYRDYVATVSAVHLPNSGIAVREQYLAVSTSG